MAAAESITVPLHIEHDRPFVDLTFVFGDGRTRGARFWVDTGAMNFSLCEPLARDLGVRLDAAEVELDYDGSALPRVLLGGVALEMGGTRTYVAREKQGLFSGMSAEGLLSGQVLSRYRAVFDYPRRTLALAPRETAPRGVAVPSPIDPRTQFPRVEVEIAGERHGMLLDTGASFTMLDRGLVDRLALEHPDWPRAAGAVGRANMIGGELDTGNVMLRPAALGWGPFELGGIGVVSRRPETFPRFSQWMTAPIAGALAGNVLKLFRVEIDYAAGVTYLEQAAEPDPHDLDMAGLTLRPGPDGEIIIDAVSDRHSDAVRGAVQVGDRLVQVDGQEMRGRSLAAAVDSLRGHPGEMRALLLARDGEHLTRSIPVLRVM